MVLNLFYSSSLEGQDIPPTVRVAHYVSDSQPGESRWPKEGRSIKIGVEEAYVRLESYLGD